jgi:hypothetical protein
VAERGCRHGFLPESRHVVGVVADERFQGLERHQAVQRSLPRLEDRAHSALSDMFKDFKFAKMLAFDKHARGTLSETRKTGRGFSASHESRG